MISSDTGEVLRTVERHWNMEAVFAGLPVAIPGTSTAYLGVAFEDAWFSCESSQRAIRTIDLTTGVMTDVTDGARPRVSPDGRSIAYLRASTCIPDPQVNLFWDVFFDTVVVRDLATGEERLFTVDEPEQMSTASDIRDIAWAADGGSVYVLDGLALLHSLDLETGRSPLGAPLVTSRLGDDWRLVGAESSGDVLFEVQHHNAATTDLYRVDSVSGGRTLVAAYPSTARFAIDATGEHFVTHFAGMLNDGETTVPVPGPIDGLSW